MKIQKIILVVGTALLLTACVAETYPGGASIYVPGVSIEKERIPHGGNFCPPGQAKKGRFKSKIKEKDIHAY